MEEIIGKVATALERTCCVNRGDAVIAAVSGGPDSVFLLEALVRLSRDEGWALELSAGHLEHGIRGNESRLDCAFVAQLCRIWDVPLVIESADVKNEKGHGRSLEEAARNTRYIFLESAAKQIEAGYVATGHTADDQAETVLLRTARGTGIEGLRGILPVRPVLEGSSTILVRPLLDVTRSEIVEYLEKRDIRWRTDSSNADTRYTRNKVRKWLSRVQDPQRQRLHAVLRSMASCASRDWPLVQDSVRTVLEGSMRKTETGIEIDIPGLGSDKEELTSYVAREIIREAAGDLRRITEKHIMDLADLIAQPGSVGSTELPRGITAVREYDTLRIGKLPDRPAPPEETELPVPGEITLPSGSTIKAELVEANLMEEVQANSKSSSVEYFDEDKLETPLSVRTRRQGDRFWPLGAPGEKKLKDFLIDIKVPQLRRDLIPLVISAGCIVWVAGHRMNEHYKINDSTKRAVRISIVKRKK